MTDAMAGFGATVVVASPLLVHGKVFGAMPLDARMSPGAARAALKMLTPGLIWFLLTLPFRREKSS